MKIKPSIKFYYWVYFLILMGLFHYKIKTYNYWRHVANLQDTVYGFSNIRFFIVILIFFINLKVLFKIDKKKLLFTVLGVFFMLVTIPSLISFTGGVVYPVKLLVYHQMFFFALYFVSKVKMSLNKLPVINKEHALFLLLGVTTIGILPYLLIYGPYIDISNLWLNNVYETRKAMGKVGNVYFGYTFSLYSKIILPLFIVFSLELKKYYFTALGVLYLILFYLFGAHKAVYTGLIMVFVFYRLSYLNAIKKMIKWSNLLITLSAILAYFSFDGLWILLFRRIHFLPGLMDVAYLDFFKNQPMYWSESILKNFITYPFDIRHTYMIGGKYFKHFDMAANNGLIADGYMNFGTTGVLINIFIISGYFMILNNLNISSKYFGLFLLAIFSFISSSVFTVFLTHGAFALLLISIFMLNEKNE